MQRIIEMNSKHDSQKYSKLSTSLWKIKQGRLPQRISKANLRQFLRTGRNGEFMTRAI